jgi:hypothetical protein
VIWFSVRFSFFKSNKRKNNATFKGKKVQENHGGGGVKSAGGGDWELVPITSKNNTSGEVDEGFETDTFCSLHGSMGVEGKGYSLQVKKFGVRVLDLHFETVLFLLAAAKRKITVLLAFFNNIFFHYHFFRDYLDVCTRGAMGGGGACDTCSFI